MTKSPSRSVLSRVIVTRNRRSNVRIKPGRHAPRRMAWVVPVAALLNLIHFERVDCPICLGECAGIVRDVCVAARCQRGACGVVLPYVAGPVTAEGVVEDTLLVLDVRIKVAGALELREWFTPVLNAGIRTAVGDVPRNGIAGEEPDGDIGGGPLSGVDATLDGIEARPVCVGVGSSDPTSRVVTLSWRLDVTIVRGDGAGEQVVVGDAAVRTGMKCH